MTPLPFGGFLNMETSMKNIILRILGVMIVFLREVRVELRKTSFPDRKLTTKNTVIVIVFSVGIALFLGGLDMGFSYILNTYIL